MDVDADVVDQARGEEGLCEFASTDQADSLAGTLLEVTNELHRVVGYQLGARFIERCEGSRKNVRALGGFPAGTTLCPICIGSRLTGPPCVTVRMIRSFR